MYLSNGKDSNDSNEIGLGCSKYSVAVYIANTPSHERCASLDSIEPVSSGEIHAIGQACGNGWRKVFNVYAKLLFQLNANLPIFATNYPSWQDYRDRELLQIGSNTALIFSPPYQVSSLTIHPLNCDQKANLHIICGKRYAQQLAAQGHLSDNLIWLDGEFAVDQRNNLFVCPYFDYRQLSNIKIEHLIKLILETN